MFHTAQLDQWSLILLLPGAKIYCLIEVTTFIRFAEGKMKHEQVKFSLQKFLNFNLLQMVLYLKLSGLGIDHQMNNDF
jgi:hypothetical protein